MTSLTSIHERWRQEVFFKDKADAVCQRRFLTENGIKRINIPHKSKEDLIAFCTALQGGQSQFDICLHLSCKLLHTGRSMEKSMQHITSTMEAARTAHAHSILLVSGGGQKLKHFHALNVLSRLKHAGGLKQQTLTCAPSVTSTSVAVPAPLHCAYNPYLSGEEANGERERLRGKLHAGVEGVYLQIGTDNTKLDEGLCFLRSLASDMGVNRLQLHGSVLLPSRKLLSQMTFRPWSGVILNKKFFSSVESAEFLMSELIRAYARHNVIPVVESPVTTVAELRRVHGLLDLYDKETASQASTC